MLQFKVVCFKNDIGIFTCYGAKVCHATVTPVDPYHKPKSNSPYGPYIPPGPPMPGPSFKDKVRYDVVLYTNPELSQSLIIYSDKNINICRLVLNNFIKMTLNGMEIIDIDKINDKTPIELIERKHGHFDDCDCDPFFNPWDKHWKDLRKNPYLDIFDYTCEHPHGIPGPPPPHDIRDPHCIHEMDERFKPLPDGCEMGFGPHHHHPEDYDVRRAITKVIPNTLERILHEVTPPERRHHHCHHHDVVFYYGNAGIAFGGSVVSNLSEINEFALSDMLRKNGHSTFSTSEDIINVKRMCKDTILETDVFTVNKTNDNEWAFFMIPDKHVNLIKSFNFYYQEDSTDNRWVEVTNQANVQREFTIQNNGIRYYIVAIKISGYYAIKFAKSGLTSDQILNGNNITPPDNENSGYTGGNTEWTGTVVFRVNGNTLPDNVSFSYKCVDDDNAMNIYFTNCLTVTLSGLEDGKEYIISKTVDGETTDMVYFTIYQKSNGATSLLTKDSAESAYVARCNNFITVNI